MWLASQNVILSNAERLRRHMSPSATCQKCGGNKETTLHILRDCPFATVIWQALIPPVKNNNFFTYNRRDWFISNLSTEDQWSCLFGVTTSCLCHFCNKMVFDEKVTVFLT
ncbi:Putative ribonuclease H protein [Arachis hypogaea]|nr:Putative ribonuclease H protein [Arachis hypogaea]